MLTTGRCRAVSGWLLVLLALTSPVQASEGNVRFTHLTLDDGLSQANVESVLQDRRGFIWLATEDGLNRYDGRTIRVYKHDSQDPTSLAHSWVRALLEGADGSLWIGSDGGLDRWRPATDDFEHVLDEGSTLDSRVRALAEDSDGNLWIGTEAGLFRRAPSGEVTPFRHDASDPTTIPDDRINALYEAQDGALWVATTTGGLARLDRASGAFDSFRHDPGDAGSLPADDVRAVLERSDGSLWVATNGGGVAKLDGRRFDRFPLPRSASGGAATVVRALLEDHRDQLWIASDGGLHRLVSEDARTFLTFRHDPADDRSLSNDRTRTLMQDAGGVVWVGTQTGGASRFNPEIGYFPHYRKSGDGGLGLTSNTTASFWEQDEHTVWVGTLGGGINVLDLESQSVRHVRKGTDARSLSDDRVMALEGDGQGGLWVGTFGGGLDHIDLSSGQVTRHPHDPSDPTSLSATGVMSLAVARDGTLWVGTFGGGLNRMSSEGTFTAFLPSDAPDSLSGDKITTLVEGDDGILWVGTRFSGLNRFDPATGQATSFRHDAEDPSTLSSNVVTSLHMDEDGDLWIGTEEGLHRWSSEAQASLTPRFDRWSEPDGLPNARVWGIEQDQQGDVWISTNRGLARLTPASGRIRTYDEARGLQSDEFNFGASHVGASGRLYFGGIDGFNAFRPEDIRDNTHVPPVIFTSLRKMNQLVSLDRPLWEIDELDLDYRDYVVSVGFAALDYTAPHLNRYEYKLDGLHEEWIALEDTTRATFAKLSPGSYTLRIRASNNEGVWNEDGATLRMNVHPPFWRSSWAFLFYGIVSLAALALYARAQSRKLRREESYSRQLEAKVRERTQELEEATVSDPLTGLKNRRYLMTTVAEELASIDRYNSSLEPGQMPRNLLFLMVDLDGLKQVNDSFGHASGDRAIVQMRGILEGACRQTDTVIRMGGDEFLVVGRDVNRDMAETLAERVRTSVETAAFDLGEHGTTSLSCSIGFAFYPFVGDAPERVTGDQVVTIADKALYVAKTSGRNAWVGIHGTALTLGEDLAEALQSGLESLVAREALAVGSSVQENELVWGQEGA